MDNRLDQTTLSIFEDYNPDTTQFITFKLDGYLFGLPSQEILKVVATPPPNQGGFVEMGMVQLGPYSIKIIDLTAVLVLKSDPPRHLLKSESVKSEIDSLFNLEDETVEVQTDSNKTPDKNPPFLVVLSNRENGFWGIALHEPPDVIEVPNYALKPVPRHQRQSQALQWVSHIVSYDLNSAPHSLLILNLARIVSPQSAATQSVERLQSTKIAPPKTFRQSV